MSVLLTILFLLLVIPIVVFYLDNKRLKKEITDLEEKTSNLRIERLKNDAYEKSIYEQRYIQVEKENRELRRIYDLCYIEKNKALQEIKLLNLDVVKYQTEVKKLNIALVKLNAKK